MTLKARRLVKINKFWHFCSCQNGQLERHPMCKHPCRKWKLCLSGFTINAEGLFLFFFLKNIDIVFCADQASTGSVISSGRCHASCLGHVFNYKLDCFSLEPSKGRAWMQIAATYRVENVAQVLSSKLKFVHAKHHRFACGDKKKFTGEIFDACCISATRIFSSKKIDSWSK